MPESSTFRNHDPPRGRHACGCGRRAGSRGGQRGLRDFSGVRVVPPGLSACVPASGRRWSSRHARGHTVGGSETGPCTACIGGRGFPDDLDEVEELDTITIWPHLAWDTSLVRPCCTTHEGSELRTPGLRPFYGPRCPPTSTRIPPTATFRPRGWHPVPGDPGENGTSSRRWRQKALERSATMNAKQTSTMET